MKNLIKRIAIYGLALTLILGLVPTTDVYASTGVVYPQKTMEEISAEFGYSFADIMADYENNVYLHDWLACLANSNATTPSEHSHGDVVYECTDTLRVNYEGEYAPAGQLLDWTKVQVFLNDIHLGNMNEYGEFYNGEVSVSIEIPYHYAREGHNAVWVDSNLTGTYGESYAFALHYIGYDPSKPIPAQKVLYTEVYPDLEYPGGTSGNIDMRTLMRCYSNQVVADEAYCTFRVNYEGTEPVGAIIDPTKVQVFWNDTYLGNMDANGYFTNDILTCYFSERDIIDVAEGDNGYSILVRFLYPDPITGATIDNVWEVAVHVQSAL